MMALARLTHGERITMRTAVGYFVISGGCTTSGMAVDPRGVIRRALVYMMACRVVNVDNGHMSDLLEGRACLVRGHSDHETMLLFQSTPPFSSITFSPELYISLISIVLC